MHVLSQRKRSAFYLLLVGLLALVFLSAPEGRAETWEVVSTRDDIAISQRRGNNDHFPTFRGVGTVQASLLHVLAVVTDVGHHEDWMFRCADSRILGRVTKSSRFLYNRTDSPWPVADRDVVLFTTMSVSPGVVTMRFRSTDRRTVTVPDGTVRMTRFHGHYRLTRLDDGRTSVEYRITADPAGRLPRWLVDAAIRRLPRETLLGLRRQTARRSAHNYAAEIKNLRQIQAELLSRR